MNIQNALLLLDGVGIVRAHDGEITLIDNDGNATPYGWNTDEYRDVMAYLADSDEYKPTRHKSVGITMYIAN